MKVPFQKKEIPCLQSLLSQVQALEQTQELRIPEGMPEAVRILGAWGQILIRSKEWQRDCVRLTGGVQARVLYEPEAGGQPRCLESWIPFRMDWDLPEGSPEGTVRLQPLLRYLDARTVSAGKVMLRAGIAIRADCWVNACPEVMVPGEVAPDVQLLRRQWPVRLPREAGEKAFDLEESLSVPPSAPRPEKIVYYRMDAWPGEQKILGNRLVFRGTAKLHLVYLCPQGQIHSWDFEIPFSQYAQLEKAISGDARGEILLALTRLELESAEEGRLQLKAGLTAQYLVEECQILETVEDAYSICRELTRETGALEVPALLESRREALSGDQTLPVQADVVADALLLADFPRQTREGEDILLEQPGTVQLLYYDHQGRLQSASHRWTGTLRLPADPGARLTARPLEAAVQAVPGTDSVTLRPEMGVQLDTAAGQGIPMVTAVELGEKKLPDPQRPSLILRRAVPAGLWAMARDSGSTVEAIRQANGLTGEPEPGKMLLIPVI